MSLLPVQVRPPSTSRALSHCILECRESRGNPGFSYETGLGLEVRFAMRTRCCLRALEGKRSSFIVF